MTTRKPREPPIHVPVVNPIYTIGYAKLEPDRLLEIAEALDVTVCDIRGKRMTRKRGFGSNQLAALLGKRYQWWGGPDGGLAGVNHGGDASRWPAAMDRLLATVKRPLLMCVCHGPANCHRHATVAAWAGSNPIDNRSDATFAGRMARVFHLFEDQVITAGELHSYWPNRDKPDASYFCTAFWQDPAELPPYLEGP